jgi:hypothetical protein
MYFVFILSPPAGPGAREARSGNYLFFFFEDFAAFFLTRFLAMVVPLLVFLLLRKVILSECAGIIY